MFVHLQIDVIIFKNFIRMRVITLVLFFASTLLFCILYDAMP